MMMLLMPHFAWTPSVSVALLTVGVFMADREGAAEERLFEAHRLAKRVNEESL
jgi:hypothetical protein